MQTKQNCPHCGNKVYTLITIKSRIKNEGILNACEYCRFEENDIKDKVSLKELYIEYNKKYFNNKLPGIHKVTLEWSNKMTRTAGSCNSKKRHIKIGAYYHNRHPEELDSTLVHEMIHLIEPNHGKGFKRELKRITDMGLTITIYTKYSEGRKEDKWRYDCINKYCGFKEGRVNRLREFKENPNMFCCPDCKSELKEVQLRE